MIRRAVQTDVAKPVIAVTQQRLGAAVTALHLLLDHQTGEQLTSTSSVESRQGEILAAELTGIHRKAFAG